MIKEQCMKNRKPFKINFNESVSESLFGGQAERKLGFTENHQTSPNLNVLNQGILKSGLRLPWFFHEDKDEVIIVLEGTGAMHIEGGDTIQLNVGDVLNVPAKTRHSLENTGLTDFIGIFFKVLVN